jgi:hypothetical protein
VRAALLGLVLAAAALLSGSAHAGGDEPDNLDAPALFKSGLDALAAGRPSEAIAKLESLGDRGVVDPVLSYDRGLAYAARVRAGAEVPGDLGRAAHGFEEARDLSHDPHLAADAATALEIVRSEVAHRRSRAGDPVEIEHGFTLGRSIVDLLPENAWAAIAGLMTLVLTASFVARRLFQARRLKVAATTAGAISGALFALTALLAWAARDARLHLREGVVVTPNARLLDEQHVVLSSVAPIPEGVRIRILDESGGFSRIVVGGATGSLPSSAVLPLAKP